MNKQQAIDFILLGLKNNRSQQEIVTALCQRIGAPPEVANKFVAEVIAQYQAAPVAAAPLRPAPRPAPTPLYHETFAMEDFAPDQTSLPASAAVHQPAAASFSAPAQTFAAPPAAPSQPVSPFPVKAAPNLNQIDPELEKHILDRLIKNHRQEDIALEICEKTGASWDQAQRLTARIATQNRKKLTTHQNMIAIPLSLAAALGGLALVLASIKETLVMISFYTTGSLPPGTPIDFDRNTIWGFFLGIGLLLGGAVGLFKALQTQFSE